MIESRKVGSMTNGAWSPRKQTVIGYMLGTKDVQIGDRVEVLRDGQRDIGTICGLPFY